MKNICKAFKLLVKSVCSQNAQLRYEARHELIGGIAHKCGFHIYNRNLMWVSDAEFLENWHKFPESEKNVVHPRKFNLYYFAKSIKNLDGDTVEAGCWHGGSTLLIMLAGQKSGKMHHIFDSFEGLSEPETADVVANDRAFKWKKHDLSTTEDILHKNIKGQGNYTVYKGWIPDHFEKVADRKFSFVHIDVDLYQPTYDTLAFFYERTLPGGIIICDDYGYETCPGAYKACNEFMEDKAETIIHLTSGQGVIIKR